MVSGGDPHAVVLLLAARRSFNRVVVVLDPPEVTVKMAILLEVCRGGGGGGGCGGVGGGGGCWRHGGAPVSVVAGGAPVSPFCKFSYGDQTENWRTVHLLRNVLGKVCEPERVHAPRLMEVDSYKSAHHGTPSVQAILRNMKGRIVRDLTSVKFRGAAVSSRTSDSALATKRT